MFKCSPDPVQHPVGLVAVTVAVSGVLGPAGGALVPPQSHGPVGEHGDALGDSPAGSGRERREAVKPGRYSGSGVERAACEHEGGGLKPE